MDDLKTLFRDAIIATNSKKYWSESLVDRCICEAALFEDKLEAILETKLKYGLEFTYSDIIQELEPNTPKIEYEEKRRDEGAMEMFLDIIEIYKTSNNKKEIQNRMKPIIAKLKERGYWEEKYE